jgi:tetratricopeptide (TPR) repeat protein
VNDLPWTDAGGAALDAYRKAVAAGLTGDTWFKLGLVLFGGGSYPESLESFRALLRNATDASDRFGGLVWQGHLLDLLGRREEALQSYRWALLLPGNLRMQHDQWGMVIDRKWVQERLSTPFARK